MNEWTELKTMGDVALALHEGMEIHEGFSEGGEWYSWNGTIWYANMKYRARPKQPVMKKVKSMCWRHKDGGGLVWGDHFISLTHQRFPAGDIEGEVEA